MSRIRRAIKGIVRSKMKILPTFTQLCVVLEDGHTVTKGREAS